MTRTAATLSAALAAAAAILAAPAPAPARCRVVQAQFVPQADLQIVIWIEDAAGAFVDTLFVTRKAGAYGLGNRPGRMDFNSQFLWPYGRRESLFPVWAHRRGVTYPRVVFQDGDEDDLSHAILYSSIEPFYCRPLSTDEDAWRLSIDAGSCATPAYTDKGRFDPTGATSLYPPRADLVYVPGTDHEDVLDFAALNDLDAISRATPAGDAPYRLWARMPDDLPDGDYVLWIEVSREFDQNESYDYPEPAGIPWASYGDPYLGQPSVLWRAPFTLDGQRRVSLALDYAGYGDPLGMDGELSPPDATITTAANRLGPATSPEGMYRLRVIADGSDDATPPEPPGALAAAEVSLDAIAIRFAAPADDGDPVTAYEVRYSVGTPLDEANFQEAGVPMAEGLEPGPPGSVETVVLDRDLVPETRYWIGVRALDDCLNPGPLAVIEVVTPEAPPGEVDACFVATAAWGSPLAREVRALRRARDELLARQALGELLIGAYYTFGPALAEAIEPADALRSLSREALTPLWGLARVLVE